MRATWLRLIDDGLIAQQNVLAERSAKLGLDTKDGSDRKITLLDHKLATAQGVVHGGTFVVQQDPGRQFIRYTTKEGKSSKGGEDHTFMLPLPYNLIVATVSSGYITYGTVCSTLEPTDPENPETKLYRPPLPNIDLMHPCAPTSGFTKNVDWANVDLDEIAHQISIGWWGQCWTNHLIYANSFGHPFWKTFGIKFPQQKQAGGWENWSQDHDVIDDYCLRAMAHWEANLRVDDLMHVKDWNPEGHLGTYWKSPRTATTSLRDYYEYGAKADRIGLGAFKDYYI